MGKSEAGRRKSKSASLQIHTYEHIPARYQSSDPAAPAVARAIGQLIEAELPGSVVEHVGSTAVEGLGGKGVVDLALIYPAGGLAAARLAVDRLGFQRQGTREPFPEERPMRVGAIDWRGRRYRLHVHVIAADSAEVGDLLSFRDSLRQDAGRREVYAKLKREILATGVTDSLDYWKAKSAFFASMDAKRSSPMAGKQSAATAHISLSDALSRIPGPAGERSVLLFEHGTLKAKLYAPRGQDPQTPHRQDEAYVVASGRGIFWDGENRKAFEPGTFLFAPAGRPHRFEDFTDDFAVWVVFYGPDGGEAGTVRSWGLGCAAVSTY